MIAHTEISSDVGRLANNGSQRELRLARAHDQHTAAVFGVAAKLRRSPVSSDHKIEIARSQPTHIVRYGKRYVLLAEQPEQSAIRTLVVRLSGIGGTGKKQYASSAALTRIVLLVIGQPAEYRFGGFKRLPVLLV